MYTRGLWTLFAFFSLAACGSSGPTLEAPELSSRRVTVDGEVLRDELRRELILRGFNVGGRAKMPPFLPFEPDPGQSNEEAADALFAGIEALGANLVRLTFTWEGYEPTRGSYDAAYLAQYRMLLDAAHEHGLFVIVDFHQDVFASPFCGDGFPLWALGDVPHGEPHWDCGFPGWSLPGLDSASPVSQAFDRLWNNTDGLQDDMEAMWRSVAAALGEHPAVAGFEVINEPGAGSVPHETFETSTLPGLYERMGRAIREEAGEVTIFGGGRMGDTLGAPNGLAPPELEGFVYAPHFYDPYVTVGAPRFDEAKVLERIATMLEPAGRWGVPVFLGEFGAMNTSPVKGPYLDVVFDALDAHRAHGAMWDAIKTTTLWNSEDFSVFDSTGAEQPWAGSVVRAYPRAVAGHIEAFSWDAEARRFELEVSGATEGVSEVYLPARHLGARPRITVTGARAQQRGELLLIEATPGARYSVVVEP